MFNCKKKKMTNDSEHNSAGWSNWPCRSSFLPFLLVMDSSMKND